MLAGLKLVNPDNAQMNNIHLDGNIGVIEKLLEKQYSDFPQNGQVRILIFFNFFFLIYQAKNVLQLIFIGVKKVILSISLVWFDLMAYQPLLII